MSFVVLREEKKEHSVYEVCRTTHKPLSISIKDVIRVSTERRCNLYFQEFLKSSLFLRKCKAEDIVKYNPGIVYLHLSEEEESEELTPYEMYELASGDPGTITLTVEGSKAFLEQLKQPDPLRDKILEESRGLSTPEQRSKFGKERVYVNFKLKDKEND